MFRKSIPSRNMLERKQPFRAYSSIVCILMYRSVNRSNQLKFVAKSRDYGIKHIE